MNPSVYAFDESLLSFCRELSNTKNQIRDHSKAVKKGDCFIALSGCQVDGHQFLAEAIQNGATTLVVESADRVPSHFTGRVYVVDSTKKIQSVLFNHYYDFPSEKLFCVGVTGTNGKTTISYMIEHIFVHQGWDTGVIGTIQQRLGNQIWESSLTTPSALSVQKRLSDFVRCKAQAVVTEVSSIGLDQNRVDGVDFNIVVFSNLTRDHLDYHKSMDDYFQAKKKLFHFSNKSQCVAVLNADDSYVYQFSKNYHLPFVSYGECGNDFRFEMVKESLSSVQFRLFFQSQTYLVCLPVLGAYNVSNAVAAIAVGVMAGFSVESAVKSLSCFSGVPGRLQKVSTKPYVFVDYAHTPKALQNTLCALKKASHQGQKIITVFGCGGERDKGKRKKMGQVVSQYSDVAVVTSDNPRGENPHVIIQDILKGFPNSSKVITEVDRKEGIKKGLELADKTDMVLIAGKGHEKIQVIGDQAIPFDDVEVAREYL